MLHGVIPALLTPFTAGGEEVDYAALERLCQHLVDTRVEGAFVTGTTGEFISLSPEERRSVIKKSHEFLSGKIKFLVHVGSYNTAEAVDLVKYSCDLGVDAVASLPPYFFGIDEDGLFAHFSAICEAAGEMPVFLYNLPQCAGNHISLDIIKKLKNVYSNLRGIKDSSGDMERLKATVELGLEDFDVVCGADHETYTGLTLGAVASVTSTGNVFAEAFHDIYNAYDGGDHDGAKKAQERLTALTKVLLEGGYVSAYKNALAMRGVDVGTVRPPQRELTETELKTLRQGLTDLNFI